jgi:hypothetical protein
MLNTNLFNRILLIFQVWTFSNDRLTNKVRNINPEYVGIPPQTLLVSSRLSAKAKLLGNIRKTQAARARETKLFFCISPCETHIVPSIDTREP